jgi:hypothetical protein
LLANGEHWGDIPLLPIQNLGEKSS